MSVQSPYGTSSWAFWPVGDRYSLTPKFEEKYADTDSTVRPQDEKNRLNLVGDWRASTVTFTMELRDMTDPKNPVVPSEQPAIFAELEKLEGWIDTLALTPEFLLDAEMVWTGDLKFTLDSDTRAWIGHSTPVKITVDAEFPTDAPERIRVGYGTIVLRR